MYTEALIICPPSHAAALTDHIQSTTPNLKVEIHAFEPKLTGPTSTIDVLRKISGRIQVRLHLDFVALSENEGSRTLSCSPVTLSQPQICH
jgi:hypothetical protein